MLKPLLLPQLVEERKKRESFQESVLENETGDLSSSAYLTQNSSASDITSPGTPTFSMRGPSRHSGSVSSIDMALYSPSVDNSPSSPTFSTLKSSKQALPDVQEEPHERDDEYIVYEPSEDELYDCFCDDRQCGHREEALMVQSSPQLSRPSDSDYDFSDGYFGDADATAYGIRSRKRSAGESPFAVMAAKINTRFPSFSRTWRLRSSSNPVSIRSRSDERRESVNSYGPSSRSSSRSNLEHSYNSQLPPTPTKSVFDGRDEHVIVTAIDIERANQDGTDHDETMASTPLLPPVMIEALANKGHVPVHSPLQSPSVAEPTDPMSTRGTVMDPATTLPQLPGMPSPPLSTKPSVSSFHHANMSRPGHLTPSSEIPPFLIADENDEWANKLGHANFNILPEPYLPSIFDIQACRQIRSDWDLARCNYTKHLVRTGEHYGVTSKIYKLTEEKWAEIDGIWKKHNNITIQNTVDNDGRAFATLKRTTFGDSSPENVMAKIPSLNDPNSQGKFPQLGDEDIVGPMVQAASQLQRTPSKKAKLMKFFAEKFPGALGRNAS